MFKKNHVLLKKQKTYAAETLAYGSYSLRSTAFLVLPNFHSCFYKSIATPRTCFLFLLGSTKMKKRAGGNDLFSCRLSKCKFSLLAPSLRQQLELVLCLHRVIETRFLTNQRGFFLGLFSDHRVIYRFRPA